MPREYWSDITIDKYFDHPGLNLATDTWKLTVPRNLVHAKLVNLRDEAVWQMEERQRARVRRVRRFQVAVQTLDQARIIQAAERPFNFPQVFADLIDSLILIENKALRAPEEEELRTQLRRFIASKLLLPAGTSNAIRILKERLLTAEAISEADLQALKGYDIPNNTHRDTFIVLIQELQNLLAQTALPPDQQQRRDELRRFIENNIDTTPKASITDGIVLQTLLDDINANRVKILSDYPKLGAISAGNDASTNITLEKRAYLLQIKAINEEIAQQNHLAYTRVHSHLTNVTVALRNDEEFYENCLLAAQAYFQNYYSGGPALTVAQRAILQDPRFMGADFVAEFPRDVRPGIRGELSRTRQTLEQQYRLRRVFNKLVSFANFHVENYMHRCERLRMEHDPENLFGDFWLSEEPLLQAKQATMKTFIQNRLRNIAGFLTVSAADIRNQFDESANGDRFTPASTSIEERAVTFSERFRDDLNNDDVHEEREYLLMHANHYKYVNTPDATKKQDFYHRLKQQLNDFNDDTGHKYIETQAKQYQATAKEIAKINEEVFNSSLIVDLRCCIQLLFNIHDDTQLPQLQRVLSQPLSGTIEETPEKIKSLIKQVMIGEDPQRAKNAATVMDAEIETAIVNLLKKIMWDPRRLKVDPSITEFVGELNAMIGAAAAPLDQQRHLVRLRNLLLTPALREQTRHSWLLERGLVTVSAATPAKLATADQIVPPQPIEKFETKLGRYEYSASIYADPEPDLPKTEEQQAQLQEKRRNLKEKVKINRLHHPQEFAFTLKSIPRTSYSFNSEGKLTHVDKNIIAFAREVAVSWLFMYDNMENQQPFYFAIPFEIGSKEYHAYRAAAICIMAELERHNQNSALLAGKPIRYKMLPDMTEAEWQLLKQRKIDVHDEYATRINEAFAIEKRQKHQQEPARVPNPDLEANDMLAKRPRTI